MKDITRIRKALTYMEGCDRYLSYEPTPFNIKSARMYLRNAKTLLRNIGEEDE